MSGQVKRWLGLTSGEETFANPRRTARYASGLIAAVVLLAFLIPDGPLRLDERWEPRQASLLEGVADEFVWMQAGKIIGRTTGYTPPLEVR